MYGDTSGISDTAQRQVLKSRRNVGLSRSGSLSPDERGPSSDRRLGPHAFIMVLEDIGAV